MKETLHLVQEWDKTFPKSDKAEHCKVTFCNRYGITLAADMYTRKVRRESFLPLRYAGRSARSKSRRPGFMRRRWRKGDF